MQNSPNSGSAAAPIVEASNRNTPDGSTYRVYKWVPSIQLKQQSAHRADDHDTHKTITACSTASHWGLHMTVTQ